MQDNIPASSPRVRLAFGGDCVACHGPLPEVDWMGGHGTGLLSPLLRYEKSVEHADITPGLASVAKRVFGMEMAARENSRMGDALLAEEAKSLTFDIGSTLHERKKQRVHAAAAEAVADLEKKWLAKAARQARKKMLKAIPVPEAIKPRKRNNFGCFV